MNEEEKAEENCKYCVKMCFDMPLVARVNCTKRVTVQDLKDKIAKLKKENRQLKKENKIMRNCYNCNNRKYNAVGDRYCTKNAYCNGTTRVLWELKEQR